MRIALILALLAAGPSLVGCGVTQVVDRADDGRAILIRSPQPDEGDLRRLGADFGVRTVVNLRGPSPGRGWYESERRGVQAIGARWEQLATSGRSAPTPELVAQFLALVEDRSSWPIVLHCQGGVHRTGVLAALYRIQYQGWSASRAIREMEDLGFDWTLVDRHALKQFLRGYRRDPTRTIPRGPAPTQEVGAAPAPPSVAAGQRS